MPEDGQSSGGTERFPPEHECQLCRLLDYRGEDINDREGVVTIAREGGGTKTIHCCDRCPDELFDTHDWMSYDDIEDQSVDVDTDLDGGGPDE